MEQSTFTILTSKGKEFVCRYDREDHELISQFTWSLHNRGYAVTTIKGKTVMMHRLILGIVDRPDVEADHIFHDKLDNRRAMLRICTRAENRRNARKLMKGTSKFKGVYRDGPYFHAQINAGKVRNLGRFYSEATAGRVYDAAAKEEYADFAYLNFPGQQLPQQLRLPI
jgi:hypothetical protein